MSVEQDQLVYTCGLILLCTLHYLTITIPYFLISVKKTLSNASEICLRERHQFKFGKIRGKNRVRLLRKNEEQILCIGT